MKIKTLLICMAVILQMCIFAGCSDDNTENMSEKDSSEISSDIENRPSDPDKIIDTDKDIILPEMDIEDITADSSDHDNKTAAETHKETQAQVKTTTPAVTNNASREELTAKEIVTDIYAESVTTVTKNDVIELPEINFE